MDDYKHRLSGTTMHKFRNTIRNLRTAKAEQTGRQEDRREAITNHIIYNGQR